MKTTLARRLVLFRLLLYSLAFISAAGLASCAGPKLSGTIPPDAMGRPYLRLHSKVGGITVWIVNGPYIRKNIDPEFTNFGQHRAFRYIPENEFWLDLENVPGEERFFIIHLDLERRLMIQGADYDSALDLAGAAERNERARTSLAEEGQSLLDVGRSTILIERVHKALWEEYSRSVKVWIVDGELVRDVFYIDFTEGGHDKVYDFVPKNEIWIDDDVVEEERRTILFHELHERRLMGDGLAYNKAHREASRKELWFRRHPDLLEAELRKEVDWTGYFVAFVIPGPSAVFE